MKAFLEVGSEELFGGSCGEPDASITVERDDDGDITLFASGEMVEASICIPAAAVPELVKLLQAAANPGRSDKLRSAAAAVEIHP